MAASNESALLFDQPGPRMRKRIRVINWIAAIVFLAVLVLILVRLYNPPNGENQLSWELWKPALDGEAWSDFYLPGLWAQGQMSGSTQRAEQNPHPWGSH